MIEPETASDAPDTRYDDLVARLRNAADNNPKYLRDVAGISAGHGVIARVLLVVADVIA